MQAKNTRGPDRTADLPLGRLRRDLAALGRRDAPRASAAERIAAELGDDLYAAVLAELSRLEADGLPLCGRSRRVA
jgi:hypothetical protein